jgi:hypothetical protein
MSEHKPPQLGSALICDASSDQAPPTHECLWCRSPIPAGRRHGSARKFCCPRHRQTFWEALRRYALAQLKVGHITVEMLRGGLQSVDACRAQPQTAFRGTTYIPLPETEKSPP